MKAWVLHDINQFQYEDVPMPTVEDGEVLVAVKAVGICGSDIPRVYQSGAHHMPLIIGHEFAGEVVNVVKETPDVTKKAADKAQESVDVAQGTVDASLVTTGKTDLIGQKVGVFPLIPCRKCLPCQNHRYEMCRQYSYLGSRQDGGFAEYVSVPGWNLIPLSQQVSYEAAAMMEPMSVAVHAIRRILPLNSVNDANHANNANNENNIDGANDENRNVYDANTIIDNEQIAANPGTNPQIAICGLGTIGLLITMFLLDAGYTNLYLIGNKDFQKEHALQLGIPEDHYCDSRKMDVTKWMLDRTEGYGADYFFECVGRNETIVQAIDLTAPGGSVCLVGNPATDMELPKNVYWKILRHQLLVTGTWNSSYDPVEGTGYAKDTLDDWQYVKSRLESGAICPEKLISHRYPLEQIDRGFEIMKDKKEDYIKVMASLI